MTTIEAKIWLGEQQLKLYNKNPMVYMNCFCSGQAIREIVRSYYNVLTQKGKLMYLEVLDKEYKAELKKMAFEIADKRLDMVGLMDLCKCLHIISNSKTLIHENLQ